MEAGAIGQVCTLCHIPFVVIKAISDKPNGGNQIEHSEYIEKVSEKCAELLF